MPNISIKEYLTQELERGVKYEYHNGSIFALAGGSINHGLLCGNIYSELRTALKNKNSNCNALDFILK